jgi:hypothetical protein
MNSKSNKHDRQFLSVVFLKDHMPDDGEMICYLDTIFHPFGARWAIS